MPIDPLIGAGLISGLGSAFTSIFNQERSQQQSKELMDYQYKLQQKAIDAANLYNSPAEQMKRLEMAHLSPNLVYGSGVDGNQSSAASPSIANRRGEMQNPLQDLPTAVANAKQLELQQIQTRNAAFESLSRRRLNEARTLGQLLDNKLADKTLNTKIHHAAQRLANDVAREGLIHQQSNNMRIQAAVLQEQADNLAARTHLTNEQALTEVVKRRALEAGIQLTIAQTREAVEMVGFISAGTQLRQQQHDIQGSAYDAVKVYQEWKAKHPKTTLTLDIVKDILGMGKDIANIAAGFAVP